MDRCQEVNVRALRTDALVTLVLEVLAVAVVKQQRVWIVLADPLHLLHVKRALGLHPLPFAATRHWDGQACETEVNTQTHTHIFMVYPVRLDSNEHNTVLQSCTSEVDRCRAKAI